VAISGPVELGLDPLGEPLHNAAASLEGIHPRKASLHLDPATLHDATSGFTPPCQGAFERAEAQPLARGSVSRSGWKDRLAGKGGR
jgi:hypothetical protein